MNEGLLSKCDKIIAVYSELSAKFRWKANDLSLRFSAFIYALSDAPFDMAKYESAVNEIKNNTGVFSYYRATLLYPMAAQLVCNFTDAGMSFRKLLEYDERLRKGGMMKTAYLGIAAYALLLTTPEDQVDARVGRALEIYRLMKKNHFWLTSSDDYAVSVLLAAEEKSVQELTDLMERYYEELHKEGFGRSNGLQFLSHLMTFSNSPVSEKVLYCREIADFLKSHKLSVSSMYYGAIGLLALLGRDGTGALGQVLEVAEYLKSKRAFKWYYKELNILMVCALVGNELIEEKKLQGSISAAAVGISIEALIAAQTAAMIAATTAATTAASAST